jgi:phage-related protein
MAGSRTLKLSILADVDNLRKNLGEGSKDVEGFGAKLGDFGKKAAAAFAVAAAAAAAYAGKLLIDGVKAAIEDEKAQIKLATSLKNVAGANNAVVASVEKYITKTALAVGVTDDELRPSFDRLVRSTKSVEEAQKLQALALDISAGSGKSLEAVSMALGRAYDGNITSLGRLGIGLSAAELKSMTFDQVTQQLAATFGGQAAEQAETFAVKMDRLKIAFDEGKETAGAFVLDAITPLISAFVTKGIPAIQQFADEIGPKLKPIIDGLIQIVRDVLLPAFKLWWGYITEIVIPAISSVLTPAFEGIKKAFNTIKQAVDNNREGFEKFKPVIKAVAEFIRDKVAPILGGAFKLALEAIGKIVGGLIDGFGKLAGFIGDAYNVMKKLVDLIKNNPLVKGIGNVVGGIFGGGKAAGGPVKAGTSYVVGERGAEMFVPKTDGVIIPNNKMGGGGVVNNFNINVSGALDQEGVARQIVDILNNSFYRGTVGAGGLVTT